MLGIVVDHDIVAVPEPVAAVIVVSREEAEEEVPEAEPLTVAAAQAVDVAAADSAGETPVRPRLRDAVAAVRPIGVAYPLIVPDIHVRKIRMAGLIDEVPRPADLRLLRLLRRLLGPRAARVLLRLTTTIVDRRRGWRLGGRRD